MKKPVPMPRTGCSRSPPPVPYMRSRKSWNGSTEPVRAVTATMPTTAGIEAFTSPAIDAGGAVGREDEVGASVQGRAVGAAAAPAARMAAKGIISTSAGRAVAWLRPTWGSRRRAATSQTGPESALAASEIGEEPFRAGVRRSRRALAVEQDAELVLDGGLPRCRAADIDVAEQHRDDLPGAARFPLAELDQRVEDGRASGFGAMRQSNADAVLDVGLIEPRLQQSQGGRERDHHHHRDRQPLARDPEEALHVEVPNTAGRVSARVRARLRHEPVEGLAVPAGEALPGRFRPDALPADRRRRRQGCALPVDLR